MGCLNPNKVLTVAYINIHGQTKLTDSKQFQIEDFLKYNKVDVAHLQETEICDDTFSNCNYISSSFNILANNAVNKYGTSSLIKSELSYEDVKYDTAGRAIVFSLGGITLGNFYGHSGTDARSRSNRENFFSEVLPQLLTNTKPAGCIGGDWNSITAKADATVNPESKQSNSLKRAVKAFDMVDSFRVLYPKVPAYSRYYGDTRGHGASRIDRQYYWGELKIKEAKYVPLPFSDHHGLVVEVILPDQLSRVLCPKGRPSYRMNDEVINDSLFKLSLSDAMIRWQSIKAFGLETLQWWELIVKPGIRKLAMARGRELTRDKKENFNLLLVRQAYLNKKVKQGNFQRLGELWAVHQEIQLWYQQACDKVKKNNQELMNFRIMRKSLSTIMNSTRS